METTIDVTKTTIGALYNACDGKLVPEHGVIVIVYPNGSDYPTIIQESIVLFQEWELRFNTHEINEDTPLMWTVHGWALLDSGYDEAFDIWNNVI